MDIAVENVQQPFPVTIMKLVGDLDASSFKSVISNGEKLFQTGTRNLVLDLSGLDFMSSSGLVAIHSLALIMRGEQPSNLEEGWSAMHAVADFVEDTTTKERNFKLLSPTPRVMQTLEKMGFDQSLEIFSNREEAIESFAIE